MLKKVLDHMRALYYDAILEKITSLLPRSFLTEDTISKGSTDFQLYIRILKAYIATLKKMEACDVNVIQSVQMRRVRRILEAARTASWWHQYFLSHNVVIESIHSLADLRKIPPITRFHIIDVPKSDLRSSPQDDARIVWRSSGGTTTGTPLTWGISKSAVILHTTAHYLRSFEEHEFPFNRAASKNFYLSFNWPHPDASTSVFKWFSAGNIQTQVARGMYEHGFEEKIRQMCTFIDALDGLAVLRVTPTTLRFLTQELQKRNLRPRIAILSVVGGILEQEVRAAALSYFACPVIAHYGSREFSGLGIECREEPGSYHTSSDRAVIEVLDESGDPVSTGVEGHMTITCLDNTDMPLIRYQPGDIGTIRSARCSCENNSPIFTISRRESDMITYGDGTTISAGYLLRYFNRTPFVSTVRRFQIRNDRAGEIRILLEMNTPLTLAARDQLASNVSAVYGNHLKCTIETPVKIEEDNRKFRIFVPLSARG